MENLLPHIQNAALLHGMWVKVKEGIKVFPVKGDAYVINF
jgi:hypothetical protein